MAGCCEYGNEHLGYVKFRDCLDQWERKYYFQKNDSAPCRWLTGWYSVVHHKFHMHLRGIKTAVYDVACRVSIDSSLGTVFKSTCYWCLL